MIYVIGIDSDRTFCYFISEASRRGIDVQPINLRAVAAEGDWRFAIPDDGESFVSVADEKFILSPMDSFYCRIMDLSAVQSDLKQAHRWRGLISGLVAWLEHIPGFVINRPNSRIDNSSKPLHEYALQCYGLNVATSLTSSDPELLTAFAQEAPAIMKPISGIRADSRIVKPEEFIDFLPSQGPIHLQRYTPGADIRAHVVGEKVHAELIRCPKVDYRQSYEEAEYFPVELPDSVTQQIIKATAAFGLIFAGWDFKLTDENQLWCLEANPMPGYDGYDRRLGGCITDSLLELLCQSEKISYEIENSNASPIVSLPYIYHLPSNRIKNIFGEIYEIPILSQKECDKVYRTVHSIRDSWILRGQSTSNFFSLGAVSYLDFPVTKDLDEDYYSKAKKYNPILRDHFDWIYQRVQQSLERILGCSTNDEHEFALPGFHIWQYPDIFTRAKASIHFDLQYRNLRWDDTSKVDFSKLISFTLPIKLPKAGGGLNVWDLEYHELKNLYYQDWESDLDRIQRLRTKTLVPYEIGNLVVHSGNSLHQIAPVSVIEDSDERITLQGHGIFYAGKWQLYW